MCNEKQYTQKPLKELNEAQDPNITEVQGPNTTIPLPNVAQAGKSKAFFIICRTPYKNGLTVTIPEKARLDLLIMFQIYTSQECAIRKTHLDKKNLKLMWN